MDHHTISTPEIILKALMQNNKNASSVHFISKLKHRSLSGDGLNIKISVCVKFDIESIMTFFKRSG